MNYKKLSQVLRYSGPTSEDDFHKLLDNDYSDHNTRLILADYLQEHDDPRAEGYRALGKLRIEPLSVLKTYLRETDEDKVGGYTLPEDWHKLTMLEMPHKETESSWAKHDTRRGAEDAAAIAFSKLPEERRKELLG